MAKFKKISPDRKEEFTAKGAAVISQPQPQPKAGQPQADKAKHARRTKAEIQAEKNTLSDNGFELIADFFKLLSDNDAAKYKIPKQPHTLFEPLARQYAAIINYFMPAAKPIYFACASCAVGSVMMLKGRSELITKALKEKESNGDKQPGEKNNSGIGKARPGEVFPNKTEPQKI